MATVNHHRPFYSWSQHGRRSHGGQCTWSPAVPVLSSLAADKRRGRVISKPNRNQVEIEASKVFAARSVVVGRYVDDGIRCDSKRSNRDYLGVRCTGSMRRTEMGVRDYR